MPANPPAPAPFGPQGVPLLGQQQQRARAQLMQAVGQLSLGIYSQLAVAHIANVDRATQEADPERLRQLARDSQTAAQCYFEGLGVAQFGPSKEGGNGATD